MTEETSLEIETKKFYSYLEILRLKYQTSEPFIRDRMLGSLERLVGSILSSRYVIKRDSGASTQKVLLAEEEKNSTVFDPLIAKKIRISAGLRQEELADYLLISQRSISGFESGKQKVRPKSTNQIAYLYWLKNVSEYNPFNL